MHMELAFSCSPQEFLLCASFEFAEFKVVVHQREHLRKTLKPAANIPAVAAEREALFMLALLI